MEIKTTRPRSAGTEIANQEVQQVSANQKNQKLNYPHIKITKTINLNNSKVMAVLKEAINARKETFKCYPQVNLASLALQKIGSMVSKTLCD